MIKYIFALVLLTECYSLKFEKSIIMNGGHCSICDQGIGEYLCSNFAEWDNGYRSFTNEIPSDHVITEVKITLTGEWGCVSEYSTVSVSLQDTFLGMTSVAGQCSCGLCDSQINFSWKHFGQCFPNYNYHGDNAIHINVPYGMICLARIDVEITHEAGNAEGCGCGSYGECKYGHMRCVDEYTYQMCTHDNSGRTYWGPIQACHTEFTCNATGDYCYCLPKPKTRDCEVDQKKCVDENSYQTCGNDGKWGIVTACEAGNKCNPDPTSQSIFCVAEEFLNQNGCEPRSMRCVTDNTYQMCHTMSNYTGIWNPVQMCAENHLCQSQDNVIYCVSTTSTCQVGDMRCTTSETYQTCSLDQQGHPGWAVEQRCQDGLTCHPDNIVIYCY